MPVEGSSIRHRFSTRFGRLGGRFLRVGDNLYATGSNEALLDQFYDPNYESLTDIVEYERSRGVELNQDNYYEVSADDIELNTIDASEATPLLETAAAADTIIGTAGVASAAAPTGTSVVTGVTLAGATLGVGLGIGLSGGATLPGHHYIGPGNDENRPEAPVDQDDYIAQAHDKAYAAAETQEDVIEADRIAIDSFDKDWQETGNIHSLAGRTGLQIKKGVESVIGVKYPSNLPVSSSGM